MGLYEVPSIEVESSQGIREVALSTRLLMERKIFLSGEIDMNQANRIVSQLLYLGKAGAEPIDIYINSSGGEVNSGLLLYDVIQGLKIPVNMYCTGIAASMAAVLLAGGQEGRRFILPHSKTMVHEPLIAGGVGGSATSIRNISESIMQTREILNGILAKHTKKSLAEVEQATSYDHYMDADESVTFGICDRICDSIFG